MKPSFVGALILVVAALSCLVSCADPPGLVNKLVERTVDASSQLVKITSKVTIENRGSAAQRTLLIGLEPGAAGRLAFAGARDSSERELRVTAAPGAEPNLYKVDLFEALAPGRTAVYRVETVQAGALAPHPAAIAQREKQLVRLEANLYWYSPYATESQKTVLVLGTKNVESHTKRKPFVQTDSTITYGPYEDIPPRSTAPLKVHYENNAPFLTVTRLERTIEVSHWGNVAVEETIDVYHSGAKLEGPFSRHEYQQDSSSGPASVKSYKTLLPASATGVYYRDTNGNISTSHMRIKKDAVELDLRPRFPLFGGWKTHYTLGYDVPSYEYLFNSGDEFVLKMRLVDHVHDDMAVDEITTTVILPEGAADVQLEAPYPIERHPDAKHYTYLDTKGRPRISFTKRDLVENHIQDFKLRYRFPRVLMLQEPLLVVAFLYALFLCVIVYVRLDFSINKDEQHRD